MGAAMRTERSGEVTRGFDHTVSGRDHGDGNVLDRIAAVVGEIDALKRERHAEPALDARARLAANYFTKRRPHPVGA